MAGIKTQGTQLWFRAGSTGSFAMTRVDGVTAIPLSGGAPSEINVTDLDSTANEIIYGLENNGSISLAMNTKETTGQEDLIAQSIGDSRTYVVGLSNGVAAPTVDATTGVITYPTTRSWRHFTGVYGGFVETYGANDAIRGTATIGVSGSVTRIKKV